MHLGLKCEALYNIGAEKIKEFYGAIGRLILSKYIGE